MVECQDGNSLLCLMFGIYSFYLCSQFGLQVNIRGMIGVGWVNIMIDGVIQVFCNNVGYGFGGLFVYVDLFLLVGVDV